MLGFWRGQRLRPLEPRPKVVRKLVETAANLNASLGDPTFFDR